MFISTPYLLPVCSTRTVVYPNSANDKKHKADNKAAESPAKHKTSYFTYIPGNQTIHN